MTPSPRDPDSSPIPPVPEQAIEAVLGSIRGACNQAIVAASPLSGSESMPPSPHSVARDVLTLAMSRDLPPEARLAPVAQTRAELLAEIDAAILREASAAQSDGRVDKAVHLTALAIDLAREFGGPFGGDGRPG